MGFDFRPRPGVTVGTEFERNEVTLPQGSFDTNLFRVEGAWDISPWSSVTGNVQYDNVSEIVGLFLKARWIIAPGNDLFLVYTQNWQDLSPRSSGPPVQHHQPRREHQAELHVPLLVGHEAARGTRACTRGLIDGTTLVGRISQ